MSNDSKNARYLQKLSISSPGSSFQQSMMLLMPSHNSLYVLCEIAYCLSKMLETPTPALQ